MVKHIQETHDTKTMTIVELGAWTGVSAEIFSRHFGRVVSVDAYTPFPGDISSQHNLDEVKKIYLKRNSDKKNVELIISKSAEAVARFPDGVDVVYIDAGHDYDSVKADLDAWKDKAKVFLCGHDYERRFQGVINAVNEYKKPDKVFSDTSWLIKKGV